MNINIDLRQFNDFIIFNMQPILDSFREETNNIQDMRTLPQEMIDRYYTHGIKISGNQNCFLLPYPYTIPYNKVMIIIDERIITFEQGMDNLFTVNSYSGYFKTSIQCVIRPLLNMIEVKSKDCNIPNDLMFILSVFERMSDTKTKEYKVLRETSKPYKHKNNITNRTETKTKPIYIVLNNERKVLRYQINRQCKPEYAFSWIVRGHYRKIKDNSIGKNQLGLYIEKGRTWIDTYTKGDKDMPLRKPQYIVKNC